MTSPPAPPPLPDDILDSLRHLEKIHTKLLHHQAAYLRHNEEFWNLAARLADLAPPPRPADPSARFWAGLLHRLVSLPRDSRLSGSPQTNLDMNSDRAGLALEALRPRLAAQTVPAARATPQ